MQPFSIPYQRPASLTDEFMHRFMSECVELAKQCSEGIRRPHVGALVVSPECVVYGRGFKCYVSNTQMLMHAERGALSDALFIRDGNLKGAYLFTTLEPCVNIKRNQLLKSCSELIVESGIELVVFGLLDDSLSQAPGAGRNYLSRRGVNAIYYDKFSDQIASELMPPPCKSRYFSKWGYNRT